MVTSDDTTIPERMCKICGVAYPLTAEYWHKDKTAKYGFTYTCKTCAKAKARKYSKDNHEEVLEKHRNYYKDNKPAFQAYRAENAEYIAEKKREWRKANPDKVKRYKSQSQKRNRASANIRSHRYIKRNPDKIRERTRIGQHRRRHAEGVFTQADIDLQIKTQTNRQGILVCWWCGEPIADKYHIDHRIPIARGGSNNPENLCIACAPCNRSKNDRLPSEWSDRLL